MKKTMLLVASLVLALTGCGAKSDKKDKNESNVNSAESSSFPKGYKRLIFGVSVDEEFLNDMLEQLEDMPDDNVASDDSILTTASVEASGNEATVTTTKIGATGTNSNVIFRGDDRVQEAIEQGFAVPVPTDSTYKIDRIVSYGGSKKNYGVFPTDSSGNDAGSIMVSYHTEPKSVKDTVSKNGIGEREIIDTELELNGKKYEAIFVLNTIDVGGKSNTTKSLYFMTDEHTRFSVSLSAYSMDKSDEALIDFAEHFDFSDAILDSEHIDEKAE